MMKMKIAGLLTLIPLAVFASGPKPLYDGYSYFSVGMQNAQYEENFVLSSGESVHSSAKVTSPVYLSGSLIYINKHFDFSMDFLSTLLPTEADEVWYKDGALAQQNKYDIMINSMQFLLHYKVNQKHRIVFGPTYSLNSFKRYTFKDENGNYLLDRATGAKLGLLEERIANLRFAVGYWYESAPHGKLHKMRYKFDATVAQALWTQASNTAFEKVVFNTTNSYEVQAHGYAGYTVMRGLEIGAYVGYAMQDKTKTDVSADGHTKWPKNTLTLLQGGVSFVWNFSD